MLSEILKFCTPTTYWEVIAGNLDKSGWRWGSISSTDQEGRQFWVVAAEREGAGRFIVHADEKLTGFVELESAIRPCGDFFLTSWRRFLQTQRR